MRKIALYIFACMALFSAQKSDNLGRDYRKPVLDIYENIETASNLILLLAQTQGTSSFNEANFLMDEKSITKENQKLLPLMQEPNAIKIETESIMMNNELKVINYANKSKLKTRK